MSKYILSENAINGITINDNTQEQANYSIIDLEDFIDTLIRWIAECKTADKALMMEDLKVLLFVEDEYILSSLSTNHYLYKGEAEFDEKCKELLELNKANQ